MTRKWKVWKRDGAWWVLDERGRLRYSSGNHMMALSFALASPVKKPKLGQFIVDHVTPFRDGGEIRFMHFDADEIKKMIRETFGDDFDTGDYE